MSPGKFSASRPPKFILICGLPGSGKSVLARAVERQRSAVRFSPDEWIIRLAGDGYDETFRANVERLQWTMAQRLLSNGIDVVLENGFWSREEREAYRKQASDIGATTIILYLRVTKEELKRRISARNESLPEHTFYVNPVDIDKWESLFSEPSAEELSAWHRSKIFAATELSSKAWDETGAGYDLAF